LVSSLLLLRLQLLERAFLLLSKWRPDLGKGLSLGKFGEAIVGFLCFSGMMSRCRQTWVGKGKGRGSFVEN